LFREAVEQADESNLIGEAQPVVGAPALGDLVQVFFGRGGGALELLAGEHLWL
jgi:hypothetical protein